MRPLLVAAWTIARRDYVSTVFSRIFLLFLVTPLFPALFGGVFGALSARSDDAPVRRAAIGVTMPVDARRALEQSRQRLVDRLGSDAIPDLIILPKENNPRPLSHTASRYDGLLSGTLERPRFVQSADSPGDIRDQVALLLDTARATERLGPKAPQPVTLPRVKVVTHPDLMHDRIGLARGSQTGLFFLIVLLAGMSLSTFIEEKSNKVIEVLAAAVPLDAIFIGKLLGMLAISLTGVSIWGFIGGIVMVSFFPHALASLPLPAVGWAAFWTLLIVYFIGSYLLLGAVFLGLGSQASSPREIQVLSMPVTMAQLVLFGFASAGVAHPTGWLANAAAIFPWSSPLAMIARAAEVPSLWPHAVAILWQSVWLVLALRLAAGLFRTAVLKSGAGKTRWFSRRAR